MAADALVSILAVDRARTRPDDAPAPAFVIVSSRCEGVFEERYDSVGARLGRASRESVHEALEHASVVHGEALGPWHEVPGEERDPVAFALRLVPASAPPG